MLNELDVKNLTKQEFYTALVEWLRCHQKDFQKKTRKNLKENLWTSFGLDEYVSLDPLLYRVESAEDSVQEHVDAFNNWQPHSQESIAMVVRGILWDMVAFKTETQCPNCKDDDLRALFDPDTEEIILSCDLCCWAQSRYGKKWSGSHNLVPANKDQLDKWSNQKKGKVFSRLIRIFRA
jgi:hypothetical protein